MTLFFLTRVVARRMTITRPLVVRQGVAVTQGKMAKRTMVMVTKTTTSAGGVPTIMNTAPVQESSPTAVTAVTAPKDANATKEQQQQQQLVITESCMKRIQSLAEKRNESPLDEVYLRVYVDAGGCSGFQYKFEMTRDAEEAIDPNEDNVFSSPHGGGGRVVVDETSLQLLKGSTIDFVQEMIKSGFAVVSNPQSESACGCGSSFAIKNFESSPALD